MDMEKRFSLKNYKENRSLPFWSWNDKLEKDRLFQQIDWMKDKGMGGFFMHARAGLKTEYLSDEWFECIRACTVYADELGLEPWAYDENGWPSGFVGGKLLNDPNNLENYLEYSIGEYDSSAYVCYDISTAKLLRTTINQTGKQYLNVYKRTAVSSVDVLDDKVVDKFIAETHEQYKIRLGEDFSKIKGFFTDEPQFCGKANVYPHLIERVYREKYNKDILDSLGLLFVEKQGYRTFRYRYWTICQELFLENFAKRIYDWCENNGVKLTGHYLEERNLYTQMLYNAGIMPFYEYEHIPGIDWLCKRFMTVVPVRQLGSVCAQLGKNQALTESYAMTGWDVTPNELKAITEFQFFYGPNKVCQHLLPYSEAGERKNDHPAHTSPINPWMEEGLKGFDDYIQSLGGAFRDSAELVNVAVFHPIRSAYFDFKFGDENSTKELDQSFLDFSNLLAKKGIGFHYLDETLLKKHGFVNGAKIGCGLKEYDYLIFPKCYTMDKSTNALVKEYYDNGGKVLFAFDKPTYLEGEEHDYSYIDSNVTLSEIISAQPYKLETFSDNVYPAYRKCGEYDCLFVLNIDDDKKAECEIKVNGFLTEYDAISDVEYASDGKFVLEPLQSKIFVIGKPRTANKRNDNSEILLTEGNLTVKGASDNCLVLDFAQVSFDGVDYGEKQWTAGIFDEMLKARYEGDLYLKFSFVVKELPSVVKLLSEYENAEIRVNGSLVEFNSSFFAEPKMRTGDIAKYLVIGENQVVVKLYFYENERVYYALFGGGVTESLRNCLVYDTYIESMRILGDFAVYTDRPMIKTAVLDTVFADDFYIGAKKPVIDEMISGGYPFFAGRINLAKTIRLDDTAVNLRVAGRLHFAKVYVNGSSAGELMFDNVIDISRCAVVGDNEIELEIYTGARNMLGPFHDARFAETGGVSPGLFAPTNVWFDKKSLVERKSYSLVRTGIFNNSVKDWYHK